MIRLVLLSPFFSYTPFFFFFFNDTATTEIYTLSLHDALPIYARPELNPEPVEIRSDPAGVRVAFVEGSIPEEFRAEESLELRRGGGDDAVDAFGMKIAAKALKMRRKQRGIGVVDLLGRVASASLAPTHHGMRVFDLIE